MQAGVGAPDGFLLSSSDKLRIVQARLDGFTFSRLAPYETWERLRDEAKSAWRIRKRTYRSSDEAARRCTYDQTRNRASYQRRKRKAKLQAKTSRGP